METLNEKLETLAVKIIDGCDFYDETNRLKDEEVLTDKQAQKIIDFLENHFDEIEDHKDYQEFPSNVLYYKLLKLVS